MISGRACQRRRAFDGVKSIHLVLACQDASPYGKIVRIADTTRDTGEEIGIERKNHLSFINVMNGMDRVTKGQACTGALVIAPHRLVLMPLRRREEAQERTQLKRQSR